MSFPTQVEETFCCCQGNEAFGRKVGFQSLFVGTPATDNYIYSSPLAVTFIPLISKAWLPLEQIGTWKGRLE